MNFAMQLSYFYNINSSDINTDIFTERLNEKIYSKVIKDNSDSLFSGLSELCPNIIPLWNLHINDVNYKIDPPIRLVLSKEDDIWIAENEKLLIYGDGETENEAIEDFIESLKEIYTHYVNIPNDQFTVDGLNKKKELIALLKKDSGSK